MDFLEQQVRSLTKHLQYLLIATCVFSCGLHKEKVCYYNIPAIRASETDLITSGGITYSNDKKFTGWSYKLYPSGDTEFIKGYYNGREESKTTKWYSNKNIAEIRWYHEGRKTGLHKGWFENGQKKFVANMEEDHYEGNVKEWFENGLLFKDFNYTNGQEYGMQKMYWSNGKIRANYQVLKGRKYGLTGVKNCVSVWSDSNIH